MTHSLPKLPYSLSSLEPHISANTLSFHHEKHHQTYVTNLNNLLQSSSLENLSLEEVILASADKSELMGIFNNAAQVWNHTFFWNSMKPQGGGKPTGKINELINSTFGSYEKFASEFKQAALGQFGSGWTWLALDGEVLKIIKTANADLPMVKGMKALLTCDVWEHAYYLDYQNRRADYVDTFLNHLVNWDFAETNLQA